MSELSLEATTKTATTDTSHICPACERGVMREFYAVDDVPTNSCILLSTTEEARSYPTGDMRLGFCDECGFIFNCAFDLKKTEYSGRYEETQAFSGTFNKFHVNLAERLINKYDIRDKDVLEIGCGKGEFLMLLSEMGNNRGVGVDPGVHVERLTGEAATRLRFISDFYSDKYVGEKVDFLACKMTLEHIPNSLAFMRDVRAGLGDQTDAVVFFQIPEATRIIETCAFEDIYYEHCAYFSPGSVARLFRRAGFDVVDLSIEYGDQYLTVEARPSKGEAVSPSPLEDDLDRLRDLVASFPARSAEKLRHWNSLLATYADQNKTVALWGSGSKAVSFLTTLDNAQAVSLVTDINPHRHGHFVPKVALPIVSPKELAQAKPDVVIAMNAIYRDEIARDLEELGVECELLAL